MNSIQKPIEKRLGMKCISCKHFFHNSFSDLKSRLVYGRKEKGGRTFGYCELTDARDHVGCHSVDEQKQNPLCSFTSAGVI